VLLNEQGNFRAIIFNRQNEIQYSTEEEGYTQGVGLTYQVDFNNFSGLLQKVGLKKKRAITKNTQENTEGNTQKDSVKTPKSSKLIHYKSIQNNN
jgi:hypothetical protein